MTKRLLALASAAALLCVGPVVAQDRSAQSTPPAASPTAPGATMDDKGAMEKRADVTGWPVFSADGQKLGEVARVDIGADGNVSAIYAEIGGFLGIGSRSVRIESAQFRHGDKRLDLSLSADEVKALPEAPAAGGSPGTPQ